jgi:hypothetical protein
VGGGFAGRFDVKTRVLIVVMSMLGGQAFAMQPAEPPRDEREALRIRLEHRLAETRQMQERLEGALRQLDEGEPAAVVRAEFDVPRGPRRDHPWRQERMRVGRDPGGIGRGDWPPRPPMLDREALVRFVREQAPELAGRLEGESRERPAMAEQMLQRIEPRVRLLMLERDREMRELRRQELGASWDVLALTRDLTEAIRQRAGAAVIGELALRLRGALGEQFDVRLAMHEREIGNLEMRLGQLREDMEAHIAARDEMVDRRVEGILKLAETVADGPPRGEP